MIASPILFYSSFSFLDSTLFCGETDRGISFLSFDEEIDGIHKLIRIHGKDCILRKSSEVQEKLEELVFHFTQFGDFPEFPLDVYGTPFQEKVWNTLQEIPSGKALSYQELAIQSGYPQSVRAVASACARNPVALLIPCHRVIRTDGSLGGYAWGLSLKKRLLEIESSKHNQNRLLSIDSPALATV